MLLLPLEQMPRAKRGAALLENPHRDSAPRDRGGQSSGRLPIGALGAGKARLRRETAASFLRRRNRRWEIALGKRYPWNAGPSARVGRLCSVIIGPGRSCMEFSMRSQISYSILAAALLGGASIANAQDVVTQPLPPGAVVVRPAQTVETVPVETVETVQTVRSVGHAARRPISRHLARSRPESVVTTTTTRRTILGERVVPAPAVIAPAPLNTVAEPTYAEIPAPAYPPRLYDIATEPV